MINARLYENTRAFTVGTIILLTNNTLCRCHIIHDIIMAETYDAIIYTIN